MADISIIIPCYLLPEKDSILLSYTRRCIESIREHTAREFELILIDNGSPVGRDYLLEQADIYVRNPRNMGYGPAVNQGLKLAEGSWLVVVNNDIEFIHDWITTAQEAWDSYAEIGAVSAYLHGRDPEHKREPERVGFRAMFGALWVTRRGVLDRVGYIDEGYELGREDRDLWVRMLESGYHIVRAGWCLHIGNATWGKVSRHSQMHRRSKDRFNEKWPQYAY